MYLKVFKKIVVGLLVLAALLVFLFYLKFLLKPTCWRLGYTLCAAVGQDFFALYQATYNFFHKIFIYGPPAAADLVTPYFMIFKYFPISPLIVGWPLLLIGQTAMESYQFYLVFTLIFYLIGFLGIFLTARKLNLNNKTKLLVFLLWFTYFPILSDLRMGQYNLISSLFFLLSLLALVSSRKIFSAVSWLLSLAFKPIALFNLIYYLKTKNKTALWGFLICFVLFTGGYLLYYQLHYPFAISDFFHTVLLAGDRTGWQIHYPDNFSVNTFFGELFYERNHLLFSLISRLYPLIVLGIFLFISYKIKFKGEIKTDLYYSLYAFSTLIMIHKEVWESWLSSWIVVIAILLIIADNYKEKIFLFLNGILLGTPSLFYFYEIHKTSFWRFLMVSEKVIPQLLIYGYLIYHLFYLIKNQRLNLLAVQQKSIGSVKPKAEINS